MNLTIFLALGDSFQNMSKSGQDERFKRFYLKKYSKEFDKVYIFSYADEVVKGLPSNVSVIANRHQLHRYIYGLLLPFFYRKHINDSQIIRAYHLSGTLPAILARVFLKKKYIFNFAYDYIGFAKVEDKWFQLILFKILQPIAVFMASKVFAANRLIFRTLPKAKSIYLPNGVDINIFKPFAKKNKNNIPVILAVGRLERQKNLKNLILATKGLKIKVRIVGNGSMRNELIKIAHKNNVDLEIIKKVSNEKMPAIYNRADIFILPSIIEGSPKALLEAMACGLPVITTNTLETGGIVKDKTNGLLIGLNIYEISTAIACLLKDKKLSRILSKQARSTVENNYNLSKLLNEEIINLKKCVS